MTKANLCLQSTFFNDRPAGAVIDTIVIHSMHSDGKTDACTCIQCLNSNQVSAHYLIQEDGTLYRCVPENKRAWHAGTSAMPFSDDCRTAVNDFSIGIELLWDNIAPFPEVQYDSLSNLIKDISSRHPIINIVGHDHIAPDRKQDPGIFFDWGLLYSRINQSGHFRIPHVKQSL